MNFQFDEKDILRIAGASKERSGKTMSVYGAPIAVKFSGKFAMFSNPYFRIERQTYPVPTFSALRNMLQAIYWHPGAMYVPALCGIRKPIHYQKISTNGINGVAKARVDKPIVLNRQTDRLQMSNQYLVNVEYYVIAFLVTVQEDMHEGDSAGKFYNILMRRIERGACAWQPFMGTRECSAYFAPIKDEEWEKENLFIPVNQDIGLMTFDFDYADKDNPIPMYQRCSIENGCVYYTGEVLHGH